MASPIDRINCTSVEIDKSLKKVEECIDKQQEIIKKQIAILSQILAQKK